MNGAALREIKPRLGRWQSAHQKERREVVMARLRLGHTRYTHGPLMAGDGGLRQCERCGVSCTISHILLECGRYRALRERHFPLLRSTREGELMGALLAEGERFRAAPLYDFLQEAGIYREI